MYIFIISDISREQQRTMLLYDYKSGLNAGHSERRINQAFGEGTIGHRTAYDWFKKFQRGQFDLKDQPRSGRPSLIDNDRLCACVESDPHLTSRELAEKFSVSHTAILHHLEEMGKVSKLDVWVPHQLTDFDRQRRIDACTTLLSKKRRLDWLNKLVTADEKWCLYSNMTRRRSWTNKGTTAQPQAKADLHQKKLMVCVWWDVKGVIHWEMLERNQSINAQLYCQQLQRVADAIAQTRPELTDVMFLHDNARPHVANLTREKLLELEWEVLPHPPYSPDLAPTDYHLFQALQNFLNGKTFATDDELKTAVGDFLKSKPVEFYNKGIHDLPRRWKQVFENNGDYIDD